MLLGKLRGAFIDMFGIGSETPTSRHPPLYPYSRPDFLDHNEADLNISSDKDQRPIILPRHFDRLPSWTGYAEAVNAGKTLLNEDQAQTKVLLLRRQTKRQRRASRPSSNGLPRSVEMGEVASEPEMSIPITYVGLFDGHAGTGAAIYARHNLHNRIMERLTSVREHLFPRPPPKRPESMNSTQCHIITERELVCGALESAFRGLDEDLRQQAAKFDIPGGCTALAAVFFRDMLFVANAGDSRAVAVVEGKAVPMSFDYTPTSDRRRIQLLAEMRPELLGGEFCPHEFCRRIFRRDVNTKVLYRHAHGEGWAVKTCTEEDLRFPLIYGNGKKSRLLGTIGVTRGFGDHSLCVFDTDIMVKPFLTACPEVRVLDLVENRPGPNDVLIMATDGLWDVCTSEHAAEIVTRALSTIDASDRNRYMVTAQELVMHARGSYTGNGWRQTRSGGLASGDDISVFVVPLEAHQRAVAARLHEEAAPSPRSSPSPPPPAEDPLTEGEGTTEAAPPTDQ